MSSVGEFRFDQKMDFIYSGSTSGKDEFGSRTMSSVARLGILGPRVLRIKPSHLQQVRNGGDTYYRRTPDTKHTMGWKFAWGLGLLTGLWMWWGLYTEFDHIKGEFPYTDPSKWTDEELGIPPEDVQLS